MNNNLATLWSNPHLRYAAGLIVALEIAAIWFPAYREQIGLTEKVITFYALAASANSAPANNNNNEPK